MPVSQQILGQFGLIRSLPRDVLDDLSARMQLREVARRAVVAAKDAPATELGFLVNGRLQGVDFTVDGRSVGLYFVDPGDFYGELSVIDALPASEFVVAASTSTVAVLEAQAARDLIFRFPDLSRHVMLRLAGRLRAVTAQRTLLGLPNPFQRLCVLILQLAQPGVGVVGGAGLSIPQVPTHQELAIMINASRETVTRAFQVLFSQGVLLREGDELRVLNARMLKDIADGRQEPPKA
jgi:CRP-like cAMP-binding protein